MTSRMTEISQRVVDLQTKNSALYSTITAAAALQTSRMEELKAVAKKPKGTPGRAERLSELTLEISQGTEEGTDYAIAVAEIQGELERLNVEYARLLRTPT